MELEAKIDAKRLALDEGVVEEESELFFSGGKDDWQKFWDTTAMQRSEISGSDFVVDALDKSYW